MFTSLKFAHTREDPLVERKVIQSLQQIFPEKTLQIALICSGGCTILDLLAYFDNQVTIHAVDMNGAQLDLFVLKRQFLDTCLHTLPFSSIRNVYKILTTTLGKHSSYELLFSELRDSDFNLEKTFSNSNLIRYFGHNAVKYSMRTRFSDHMKKVLSETKSYFNDLIFKGNFSDEFPFFLTDEGLAKLLFQSQIWPTLHNQDIISFLVKFPEMKETEKLHFLQISNITDWMSKDDRKELITLCFSSLQRGGKLVARRFNGDYSLQRLLKDAGFIVENQTEMDRSAFYSEVLIGMKPLKHFQQSAL